jgi:hypothetical protein
MTTDHPITPTLKLFREWTEYRGADCEDQFWWRVATQAARWGADQELEACCTWLDRNNQWAKVDIDELRDARRPKPPSLKEQALQALALLKVDASTHGLGFDSSAIRRALESLPD